VAAKLSISFSGDLLLQLSSAACAGGSTDPGSGFTLRLISANREADESIGQKLGQVDSPAAFVALPYPSSLLGRVLYFRGLGERDVWDVRVTYATSGQVTQPVQGMILVEAPDGDEITAVAVQGSGEFEYQIWGALV
jgi:hypothetical protein